MPQKSSIGEWKFNFLQTDRAVIGKLHFQKQRENAPLAPPLYPSQPHASPLRCLFRLGKEGIIPFSCFSTPVSITLWWLFSDYNTCINALWYSPIFNLDAYLIWKSNKTTVSLFSRFHILQNHLFNVNYLLLVSFSLFLAQFSTLCFYCPSSRFQISSNFLFPISLFPPFFDTIQNFSLFDFYTKLKFIYFNEVI